MKLRRFKFPMGLVVVVAATIVALCAMPSPVDAAMVSYAKPVDNWPNLLSPAYNYGSWVNSIPGYHLGVDIKGTAGKTTVHAVLDGTVISSRTNVQGYASCSNWSLGGGAIIIEHTNKNGNKFYATYGHLGPTVKTGDRVNRGQKIGTLTPYPNCSAHLHFGITTKKLSGDPQFKGYAKTVQLWKEWGFVNPIDYLNSYGSNGSIDLPSTSASIPNGIYEIEWGSTGRLLDVKSKSANDSVPLVLWGRYDQDNQRFQLTRQSDNTYMISAVHSGKTVEVKGYDNYPANGTVIQQYSTSATNDSSWYIVDVGGGLYSFVNKTSGKAMDVRGGVNNNGTNVQVWDWDKGQPNQKFKLIAYVEKCKISGKTNLNADDPNCKEDKVSTPSTPSTPTQPQQRPQYNLNVGYYLGVKKFGGPNYYKEGYYPSACDWSSNGTSIQYPDGRDCSGDVYKLVDEGVVVLDNLCAVESAIKAFTTTQIAKATNAGYKFIRAGYGAGPGCDDPERIEREKITEATCSQYGLSCGRW